MHLARRWRTLATFLLALSLAGVSGCLGALHPVDPAPEDLLHLCQASPPGARDHVHVFIIRGIEPVDCTNINGLRAYIHGLGFHHTYLGTWVSTAHFRKEICRIHEQDPCACFVLIGFSAGANMVRNIAQAVKEEGIPVQLLVYLGGNTLGNTPRDQPENVGKIVNVLAEYGWIWHGDQMDRAENLRADGVWHFGSPTHPVTLDTLARELAVVALQAPGESATPPVVPPPLRATGAQAGKHVTPASLLNQLP
jgi:hypothetical protein